MGQKVLAMTYNKHPHFRLLFASSIFTFHQRRRLALTPHSSPTRRLTEKSKIRYMQIENLSMLFMSYVESSLIPCLPLNFLSINPLLYIRDGKSKGISHSLKVQRGFLPFCEGRRKPKWVFSHLTEQSSHSNPFRCLVRSELGKTRQKQI